MAKILFASNNIAHFIGTAAGSVANTFDPNRVPYTIDLQKNQVTGSPIFNESDTAETWFHFRFYSADTGNSEYADSNLFFEAFDTNDNQLFYMKKKDNSYDMIPDIDLFDGTSIKSGFTGTPITKGIINSIDIKYTVSPTLIDLEFFINGSSQYHETFNANGNSYGKPIRFTLGGAFVNQGSTVMSLSEIIVSNESTINARADMLRPVAAGALSEWNGLISTLGDDDRTSGMTTLAAAKRQLMTLAAYNGANNISNVVAVSTSTRGLNAPTKLSHTIRMGGVNYDGVQHDIPYEAKYLITDYNINPATSLAWVASDLVAAELGFVSIA